MTVNTGEVIMNGCQWAEWAPFSVCSKTCGGGRKVMEIMIVVETLFIMMMMVTLVIASNQSSISQHAHRNGGHVMTISLMPISNIFVISFIPLCNDNVCNIIYADPDKGETSWYGDM